MIRKMGNYDVSQRTKDGMFNATSLMKQWNESKGGSKKEMGDFFRTKSTKEFIEVIESDSKDGNSPYLKTRGKYGGTWMHPYLFIDFAMWINPRFKLEVIKFVYDQLIKNRHLAGDNYKTLSSSGVTLNGYDFSKVAKALQHIVFDKTGKGLRQLGTQEQLEELADIEAKLAWAIDMGYIRSFQELMIELRKMYNSKYNLTHNLIK